MASMARLGLTIGRHATGPRRLVAAPEADDALAEVPGVVELHTAAVVVPHVLDVALIAVGVPAHRHPVAAHRAAFPVAVYPQMVVEVLRAAELPPADELLAEAGDGGAALEASAVHALHDAVLGEQRRHALGVAGVVGPGITGEQVEDVQAVFRAHAMLRHTGFLPMACGRRVRTRRRLSLAWQRPIQPRGGHR